MKSQRWMIASGIFAVLLIIITVLSYVELPKSVEKENANIILYGEGHGMKEFYDVEFAAWKEFYEQEGMRDLFVELPYYTAEFLNLWMQEEDDAILEQLYGDMTGTASATTDYLDFFRNIKRECPDTVFYGTDVGHQYDTTGMRYLEYLDEHAPDEKVKYNLAVENILQGQEWYQRQEPVDWAWREDKMIENFIRAYDSIGQKKIMGIYGGDHIAQSDPEIMAGAIKEHYGDTVSSIYVYSKHMAERSYQFGFSYIGLLFVVMLLVPNICWACVQKKACSRKNIKCVMEERNASSESMEAMDEVKMQQAEQIEEVKESKFLQLCERIGQVSVVGISLIFTDFNPIIYVGATWILIPSRLYYLAFAFMLMVMYECYWIRYFQSERTQKDLYADFLGIPLAGAVLPVLAFAVLAIYGGNLFLLGSAVILGIGHIGIHLEQYKRVLVSENKRTAGSC